MTTMRVVGECFFWYRLTRVFPDKFHRAVKRLCVCVCFRWIFSHTPAVTPQHAGVIDQSMTSLSLAGDASTCASTLLGRCLCKRVDVYIIILSCTWRIYALSERLLVFNKEMVCLPIFLFLSACTTFDDHFSGSGGVSRFLRKTWSQLTNPGLWRKSQAIKQVCMAH